MRAWRWGDVLGQNCCKIVREERSERSGPPMNFTRGQQSTRERPEHKLPDSTTIMNDMFDILTLQTVYKFEMSKSKQNKRFCRRNADNQFLVCSGLQNMEDAFLHSTVCSPANRATPVKVQIVL